LGVVKNPFRRFDPIVVENGAGMRILDSAQGRFYRRDVILRQIAGIGPRISNDFEALVKLLRNLQGAFGAKAATVRIPLQTGQIVKKRRRLRGRLAFFSRNARFAKAAALDLVRSRLVPNPLRPRVFVAVFGEISSERKRLKASRIDSVVIDCSHKRRMGFLTPLSLTRYLKINSPSRPASQALIRRSTSGRCIKRLSMLKRAFVFSIGLS